MVIKANEEVIRKKTTPPSSPLFRGKWFGECGGGFQTRSLLVLLLVLSAEAQTFQYSRGWTNGKRSGGPFLASSPEIIPQSDPVLLPDSTLELFIPGGGPNPGRFQMGFLSPQGAAATSAAASVGQGQGQGQIPGQQRYRNGAEYAGQYLFKRSTTSGSAGGSVRKSAWALDSDGGGNLSGPDLGLPLNGARPRPQILN